MWLFCFVSCWQPEWKSVHQFWFITYHYQCPTLIRSNENFKVCCSFLLWWSNWLIQTGFIFHSLIAIQGILCDTCVNLLNVSIELFWSFVTQNIILCSIFVTQNLILWSILWHRIWSCGPFLWHRIWSCGPFLWHKTWSYVLICDTQKLILFLIFVTLILYSTT